MKRVLAFAAACVALAGLVACSGSGAAASGASGDAPAGSDAVYMVTETTNHTTGQTVTYERDAHGNTVAAEIRKDGAVTSRSEYEVDGNGYVAVDTRVIMDPGTGKKSGPYRSTAEVTLNGDGLASTLVVEGSEEYEEDHDGRSLSSKVTYEYYADGRQKSAITEGWGYLRKAEYDSEGYIRRLEKDGVSTDFAWEFDSAGRATGYTASSASGSARYRCETDAAGNIVEISDEAGTVLATYEYQRVDDPSKAVRSFAVKQFLEQAAS